MKSFISIAFATLLAAQTCLTGAAQGRNWRTYLPPDRSFSIELPGRLTKVSSFDGEHGANSDPSQREKGVSSYFAAEGATEDGRLGIVVINGNSEFSDSQDRTEALEGLSWFLIADEDELQFLTAATRIQHRGLVGQEYFYIKDVADHRPLFTRGRIFDAGTRIYVLIFIGRDVKDLSSKDAERFFGSFRLLRRKRRG